ncbi:MAG: nucleotidyltransferase family protein [Myxococcaceae bacterium]
MPKAFDLFALLSGEPIARIARPDALVHAATVHGLAGVVTHELSSKGIDLPESARKRLLSEARSLAGQALKTKMLLARTLKAFAEAGVRPVVLKGYALGARTYPDPLLRPTSDVDVLVRSDELALCEAALLKLGLQPQAEEQRTYAREHHHHLSYSGPAGLVELHFRPIAGFGASIEWEDLQAPLWNDLEGSPLSYLAPEDELTYLGVHAAQHAFARVSWLYDLRRFVGAHPELDWEKVVALASRTGFAVPLWSALTSAERCFDAEIPPHVLRELSPSLPRARVLGVLFSEARLHEGAFTDDRKLYAAQFLMTATANRAVRFATHHTLRAAKRKVAFRFPDLAPRSWRG